MLIKLEPIVDKKTGWLIYPDLREEMFPMYEAIYNTTDREKIIELIKGDFYGKTTKFNAKTIPNIYA